MPRRFLHFCGDSGIGKKTLFKKLVDGSAPGLRERFGIDGPLGAYAHYSHLGVKPIFQYIDAQEDIVLHNWQLATHGWIAHNMRAHPSVDQGVYLVWQPFEAHSRNLATRAERATVGSDVHGWRPSAQQLRERWNKQFAPIFRQVESWGLKVEVIDASTELCDPVPDWPS
jgi:hypothetical protein